MALINYPIGPRAHELIRDRVGEIIFVELANQFAISYDETLAADVFIERNKPTQPDEFPMVNISVIKGDFDNQSVEKSDGTFQFAIDCYTKSATTDNQRGDVLSMFAAQRLAAVVMAILDDTQYFRLGFAPPFIMGSHVQSFELSEPDPNETTNISVNRIILNVRANQPENPQTPIPIGGNTTGVKLDLTDKGYQYVLN